MSSAPIYNGDYCRGRADAHALICASGPLALHVGLVGPAEKLWHFALMDLGLLGGTFKVIATHPNDLYLGKGITREEYNAL